jgi:hypothetical protein
VPPDRSTPTSALADRHLSAVEALFDTVQTAERAQREQIAAFKRALQGGDKAAALEARDAMWETLYPLFERVFELAEGWNNLTYRTADDEF